MVTRLINKIIPFSALTDIISFQTVLESAGIHYKIKDQSFIILSDLDWLDFSIFQQKLDKKIYENIDFFYSIDSTNQYLLTKNFDSIKIAITEMQTKGRGRKQRTWISPLASNIYLSFGIQIKNPITSAISIIIAIALAQWLNSKGLFIQIKWPNDLIAEGKKLAGLLIESKNSKNNLKLIVGIGLNVAMPKYSMATITQPWIDLKTLGIAQSRSILASEIMRVLTQVLQNIAFNQTENYLHLWPTLDALYGKQVNITIDDTTIIGIASGIDNQGGLQIKTPQGIQTFYTGEATVRLIL